MNLISRFKQFLRTSILGGVVVVLPVAILFIIFKWIYTAVTGVIHPLTSMLMEKSQMLEILADVFVVSLILLSCFFIGIVIRTRFGRLIHKLFEDSFLSYTPGYSTVKEIVMQFLGAKKSPFSSVALVDLHGFKATAFVTDEHPNDMVTVFVPTSPNPTSGFVFHVPRSAIQVVNVSIETTMRSVIACGNGAGPLLAHLKDQLSKPPNSI